MVHCVCANKQSMLIMHLIAVISVGHNKTHIRCTENIVNFIAVNIGIGIAQQNFLAKISEHWTSEILSKSPNSISVACRIFNQATEFAVCHENEQSRGI